MVAEAVHNTIEGTVSRTNDHGFCMQGRDGWLNLSQYAQPTPLLPRKGMHVSVGLDKGGYVRTVSAIPKSLQMPGYGLSDSHEPPEALGQAGDLLYLSDAQRSPELARPPVRKPAPAVQPVMEVLVSSGHPPDKDARITRMNTLTTATAIASSGGRVAEPKDVLALAATLEAWINR